jgi:nitroimidazol reductase NimA-like FMN-containing flavoprotein (pyridoxamine 5'-phosphate oxidase superfamily)
VNTPPELQVLSADDCYQLLTTQQIGRLGVNAEHYPLIFPVNYVLDPAGVIVIRTDSGTKLAAADHANVTFEVDEIDQWTLIPQSITGRRIVPGELPPAFEPGAYL